MDRTKMELERLVNQFFDQKIPHEQLISIDQQLQAYRTRPEAWRDAFEILRRDSSEYMRWFSYSILEDFFLRHWHTLGEKDQEQIRDFLLQQIDCKQTNMTFNKLIKVVVDCAKRMWPHRFPQLFPMIQKSILGNNSETGLILLKTLLEEFVSNKAEMSSDRKDEIKTLLLNNTIGSVMQLMKLVLDGVYHQDALSKSQGYQPSYQNFQLSMSQGSKFTVPRGQFDQQSKTVCKLALEVLINIFAWIPLTSGSNFVTIELLESILKLTHLNDLNTVEVGCLALSCMNELLSRKLVPSNLVTFQEVVFGHIFEGLRHLTDDSDNQNFEDLDDDYRTVFTDFIGLFIQTNIHRVEANSKLPLPMFLELLYKFTLQQPNNEAFKQCLEVWNYLLEFVCDNPGLAPKYKSGLLMFMGDLLNRMQYDKNSSQLSEVDDTHQNSFKKTEYDIFMEQCLDICQKAVQLYPVDCVAMFCNCFLNLCEQFDQVCQSGRSSPVLISAAVSMSHTFKDLRTLLRVVGSLSGVFLQNFESTAQQTFGLLQSFLKVIAGCFNSYDHNTDMIEFAQLFAETFSVFSAYIYWLVQLQNVDKTFDGLAQDIMQACIAACRNGMSPIVILAASKTYRSICMTVKPQNMFQYNGVGEFIGNIHDIAASLQSQVKGNLYVGTSFALLTILPHLQNEVTPEFQSFVDGIVQPFLSLKSADVAIFQNESTKAKVYHVLVALTSFLVSVEGEKAATRQMLYMTIVDTVPLALELLKVYENDQEMTLHIVELCLALMTSLRRQIGQELLQMLMNTFFQVFDGDRLKTIVQDSNIDDNNVLIGYMNLLKIAVEENSKQFSAYLPGIISFVYGRCNYVLQEYNTEAADSCRTHHLDLIQSILLNHWKHFFPNNAGNDGRPVSPSGESVQEFDGLLTVLLNTFKSTNMELLKHNVQVLDELNSKCRLYTNGYFQVHMMRTFVYTVLSVLVEKSHDSIREELIQFIYSLANVNMAQFYEDMLPGYLQTRDDLTIEHRHAIARNFKVVTDAPSFHTFLNRLVDDMIFYHRVDQPQTSLVSTAL